MYFNVYTFHVAKGIIFLNGFFQNLFIISIYIFLCTFYVILYR